MVNVLVNILVRLVARGLFRAAIRAPSMLSSGSKSRGLWRPTGSPGNPSGAPGPMPFVALPNQMAPGYCWMCGGKVRKGRPLCYHCGASQPSAPAPESDVAQASGFDPSGSSIGIPRVSQMAPPPPPMRGPGRRGPDPRWSGGRSGPPDNWRR